MNYLDRLKGAISEKRLPCAPTKPTKAPSVSFVGAENRHIPESGGASVSFVSSPSTHISKIEGAQSGTRETAQPDPRGATEATALPAWCRGAACWRFEIPGKTTGPGCVSMDGDTWRPLRDLAGCPLARIKAVVGIPCGRCGERRYVPAPGGWTWPDGTKDDGWSCTGCGTVYPRHGADLVRHGQGGEKLSGLFGQLPAGHFVKMRED